MRTILWVLLLVACGSRAPGPLDVVARCAPGQRFTVCHDALRDDGLAKKPTIPAGDLVSIEIFGASLTGGRIPRAGAEQDSVPRAYRYAMRFRDGYGTVRERVLGLLVARLGEPTRIVGSPPIADPGCPGGDYWMASDGLWILSGTMVTWYSAPITGVTREDLFPWRDRPRFDAPFSGPLWRDIGRLLVTY